MQEHAHAGTVLCKLDGGWRRGGGQKDRSWKEREREKESMIQKRRSLHSGHVRCRLALYGAITYAPPRGGFSFYASVRPGRTRGGKKSEIAKRGIDERGTSRGERRDFT